MITLTDENFEKEITKSDKPVLVDFWALWCSPCFVLTPILEKLAEEYKDKFILAKVNLDYAPIAAQKYRIDRIPAVVLFKNGKPVSGFIGVKPEPVVKDIISQMLEDSEKKIGEIENIIKNYQEYAQKNGFKLNPDKGIVERLVKGLLENEKKYGARYCPCRRITGNPEDDKGKICPCYWHQEELERDGHCFCGLFVK
ncbi:MAG: thioredoxin [Candidatus Nealsonbacteria bacterium]